MAKTIFIIAAAMFAVGSAAGDAGAQQRDARNLTDAQIRELIVVQSTEQYAGACACPYSLTTDDRTCGERSAYNRSGGSALICYARDVSDEMVRQYRSR
jgi:hypothetical protein